MDINLTALQSRHCQDEFQHTVFTSMQGRSFKRGRHIYCFVTLLSLYPKFVQLMLEIYCGTALQGKILQVRLPIGSLRFFFYLILQALYGPGVNSLSNRHHYQLYVLGNKGGRCKRADKHATFLC
jgi:hypothetical protein